VARWWRHGCGDSEAVAWWHGHGGGGDGGGGATMAWWPGGTAAAAAMVVARGNLGERKPLFEARNRILWLATVSRMPAPSSKISRSPKFSAQ
jgi:hypothetical protein